MHTAVVFEVFIPECAYQYEEMADRNFRLRVRRAQCATESGSCRARPARYVSNPSRHGRNVLSPRAFSALFSSTEYAGRGTLAGNSFGPAICKRTRVFVRWKISWANSYQEQLPSEVA